MDEVSLKKIWNVLFDGIILTNKNGLIRDMNRTAKRLFSIHSTIEGISIFELIPEDLKKHSESLKEVTAIRISFGTEEFLMNIMPMDDNCIYIFKSITEVQDLKHEIKKKNIAIKSFDEIADHLEEGICAIDSDYNVTFYNKKMGEIDVREPDAVRGKSFKDTFPDKDDKSSKLLKSFTTEKCLNHRETNFTSEGKSITTLSKSLPLVSGKSKIGAVKIVKDITNQKYLEDTILKIKQDNTEDPENIPHSKNNTIFKFDHII